MRYGKYIHVMSCEGGSAVAQGPCEDSDCTECGNTTMLLDPQGGCTQGIGGADVAFTTELECPVSIATELHLRCAEALRREAF